MQHVTLANASDVFHRAQCFVQAIALANAIYQPRLRHKAERAFVQGSTKRTEHGPVVHRLWRGDGGIGVTHGGHGDEAPLHDDERFDAKKRRFPQHDVGPFAYLDAAHLVADAVCNRRVDGELGHIAFDAAVVVSIVVAHQTVRPKGGQFAALLLHLVCGLPAAHDDLTHAAHGLRVRGEHADRAQVVQDVFGSDGFFADAALGKCQILGDGRIQVVADHQHVHVFVQRVDGVGPSGVGGGGQHIGFAHHFQNVRRMTATRTFGVEGVDGAAFESRNGVFHKT